MNWVKRHWLLIATLIILIFLWSNTGYLIVKLIDINPIEATKIAEGAWLVTFAVVSIAGIIQLIRDKRSKHHGKCI